MYECGSVPVASTVNFRAREVVPNFTFATLSGDDVCFRSSVATHILVDSFGWSTGTGGLRGLQPSRVLDTRNNTWSIGPAQSGQDLRLRVAGRGGVPNDAAAALLTITVDSITGGGFVTAWPCDEAMPTASVLNLWTGTVRSNLALVKLSADDGRGVPAPDAVQRLVDHADRRCRRLDAGRASPWPGAAAPDTAAPVPDRAGSSRTLPVGAALPSEARVCEPACAARREIRAVNVPYNNTRGTSPHDEDASV